VAKSRIGPTDVLVGTNQCCEWSSLKQTTTKRDRKRERERERDRSKL